MNSLPGHEEYCADCRWAEACLPLSELKALVMSRGSLETDYGWDVFGFIAEAKRQFRRARSNRCPSLDRVREAAAALAPEVDFEHVS